MPHIKINQPNETYMGTTIEIDGERIKGVRSISYHVRCDSEKPPVVNMEVNSGGAELEMFTDCINLDISPVNVDGAIEILRYSLSKGNISYKHNGTDNELRKGFLASIKSALEEGFSMPDGVTDDELAEKILDRLIGED